MDLLKDP